MIDIPLGLKHALESGGECVLFLGAGMGHYLLDSTGKPAPDGKTLAKELAENFSIEAKGDYSLSKISYIVELRKGRAELDTFLRKRLNNFEPDKYFQWLSSFRWRAIYTTNYDCGIERAYALNPKPPQKPIIFTVASDIASFDSRFEVPIYHLHGSLFTSSSQRIIITEKDYTEFQERRRMLFNLLKKDSATSTILYIGYANSDPNWKTVISEAASEFYPSHLPPSYRIDPEGDSMDIEILKSEGIETIVSTYNDFADSAKAVLSDSKIGQDTFTALRSKIPTDFIPIFDKTPASVIRLLASWMYVNDAPFEATPNISAFLRGDRANWALIGSGGYFERDIEEQIYNDLLDYATSSATKPSVDIILGSAGYGTTTLMMSLAVKLIKEKAGPVFMIKPSQFLNEGDIEFAATAFSGRPFFFIDTAAEYAYPLKTIIQRFKEKKIPAMLVLGERLNEWRQGAGKIYGREFGLESLSDPEIKRLLDCLKKHGELNQLEHLSDDLQFSAIKEKHGKELLVAMREATEGKSFDAILEDEFRGIGDEFSRRLYLAVCCFYQHGACIRDDLLAQLMGINLAQLYEKIKDTTEGIVRFDCINESEGQYAARARHRTIATVVWERCGSASDKESILQASLAALNLNYKVDKDAFEFFIKSDRMIDEIRGFEGKVKFFDTACRKDPESPYVRQHYARMLLRENKDELALGQSKEALNIDSKSYMLHHTHGMILMQMALKLDSVDIARKRLLQSEESFLRTLRSDNKNEYGYQGLAQLYFGWAKRAPTTEESAEYISKAEEKISEGLRLVRERDGLWIESAKIQKWLRDKPAHLKVLEKALQDSPGSIIVRSLLGRAYRKEGEYQKALDVLLPIVKSNHDEFRVFIEYALSLLYLKKSYKSAIAILRLSTTFGLSDSRFIAILSGMLVMDGQISEASKVFEETAKHNFTLSELNTIYFRPPNFEDLDKHLCIKGKVIVVKAGYSIVQADGFPNFLCPGSKWNGLMMTKGLIINFKPGFTAKACVADKPTASA